jgi:molybdate transport system substrate-binding protein
MFRRVVLVALALALAHGACAQSVTVFAAASLKSALDELNGEWRASGHPSAVIAYGPSSALARQIENGAPANVFIAADTDWMDYVERRGRLEPGSRVNLLRNDIVLIAPVESKVSLAIAPRFPLAAALGNERLAMADPDHVPGGKYGKAALETLGVWTSVSGKLARAEDVRAALNFVARGEAALGIVYRTDAAAEPRVRIVGVFPADSHPPIVYPAGLVRDDGSARDKGRHVGSERGADFLAFLESAPATAVFRKYGFRPY